MGTSKTEKIKSVFKSRKKSVSASPTFTHPTGGQLMPWCSSYGGRGQNTPADFSRSGSRVTFIMENLAVGRGTKNHHKLQIKCYKSNVLVDVSALAPSGLRLLAISKSLQLLETTAIPTHETKPIQLLSRLKHTGICLKKSVKTFLFLDSSSHVTRHTSHVTRHTSHVTRHTSHVTRHTSHVNVENSEAPSQLFS